MNYLALCQAVRRNCGISGTGPTSVLNNTGELDRVVNWVADEYTKLQAEEPNWRWLRSEFSIQTTASDDSYAYSDAAVTDSFTGAAITRFVRWWEEDIQIYLTSAGLGTRHPIPFVRWETWRKIWLIGNMNAAYPAMVSIDPRNNLRLGAKPDNIYTVTGEYQKSAQTLAADNDTPEMPPQFHNIIVARAMKRYAAYHSAPEVFAEAEAIETPLIGALRVDQLPPPRLARPLC